LLQRITLDGIGLKRSPASSSPSTQTSFQVPLIQVSNLTYTYNGSKTPALQELNLRIYSGEFVIIAGPSGSGKSTLARCLTGFIPHEYPGIFQGTISILSQETKARSIPELAHSISLIQQDPDSQLVTLNVTNEVAFGLENFQYPSAAIKPRIEWALDAINAQNLMNRSTHTLSGGEKQKIAIASFIALQPPIVIFDEPTARLDSQTTKGVLNTLQALHKQGTTILVIEHRIQPFLALASRVLLLNEGRVSYDGTPDQLSTLPTTLADLGVALHPSIYSEKITDVPLPQKELMEIRNLTFTYPSIEEQSTPRPALSNLTFSLHPGEIVALMGSNGSGKSTLLLQLMGLLSPDSGTIHLEQQNIHEQPVSQLARRIGFIFQNPLHQLFASTVKEEVVLASKHLGIPEPSEAELQAKKLLYAFGLLTYQEQSPYTLSLGEQRRLTIASILLHKPRILLLDEPFIGQDYRNVHRIMTILRHEASQGTSILLATHDLAIAATYCTRLFFLHDGRLLIDAPIKQGLEYLAMVDPSTYSHTPKTVECESEK
jgi:energy-coupling factor transporter ATP-binding protein EcfA2